MSFEAIVGVLSCFCAALFFARIVCGSGILSQSIDQTTFSLKASVIILLSSASTSFLSSGDTSSKVRATYCFNGSGNVVLEVLDWDAGDVWDGVCYCPKNFSTIVGPKTRIAHHRVIPSRSGGSKASSSVDCGE